VGWVGGLFTHTSTPLTHRNENYLLEAAKKNTARGAGKKSPRWSKSLNNPRHKSCCFARQNSPEKVSHRPQLTLHM